MINLFTCDQKVRYCVILLLWLMHAVANILSHSGDPYFENDANPNRSVRPRLRNPRHRDDRLPTKIK